MKESEINALISLLEDPDWTVYEAVKNRLSDLGTEILPHLKSASELSNNELFIERSSHIIADLQFSETFSLFKNWVHADSSNLLEGAYLVAKFNYPELEYDLILQKTEKIKRDAWLQLNENLTPLEQIRVLNHIIFNIHKFTKNSLDFYSPKNSYINLVLESKKGNPVTLAILYLAIAVKLGIPLYGVNLPKNFILAYVEELYPSKIENNADDRIVSFYINPYNNGAILTKREIDYFLKQQKIQPLDSFYYPCDNLAIIQRLILNLVFSYERLENYEKVEELKKFLNVFDKPLPDISY
ncbi:MAG: transglutaminase-like domain-containing protein [Bacteroidales bacterium]